MIKSVDKDESLCYFVVKWVKMRLIKKISFYIDFCGRVIEKEM